MAKKNHVGLPERIAIVGGLRTPFCKAGGSLKKVKADELGAMVTRELLKASPISEDQIDEVIFGCVSQPADAANIARIVALKAGLPAHIPAYTVHRNCASGMEAITTATNKILAGKADIILVGGTESMSNIPLMYNEKAVSWFTKMMSAKGMFAKAKAIGSFKPSMLDPVIGIKLGLTDPVCGLNMGETAEVLASEFGISREDQDSFALLSHQRAAAAQQAGLFQAETVHVFGGDYDTVVHKDDSIRPKQSLEALGRLRPYFKKVGGTVTAGNACPITDGAAAMFVMKESKAKELGLTPLGYLCDYEYAGLDGSRMGLGPVYATSKLLSKSGHSLDVFDRIEINEAFAAQVLACGAAFESNTFAKKYLNRTKKLGIMHMAKTNVNGGAIALGHPVGTTGARLVLTNLLELRRQGLNTGLSTLCIGGGQGAALWLEVN